MIGLQGTLGAVPRVAAALVAMVAIGTMTAPKEAIGAWETDNPNVAVDLSVLENDGAAPAPRSGLAPGVRAGLRVPGAETPVSELYVRPESGAVRILPPGPRPTSKPAAKPAAEPMAPAEQDIAGTPAEGTPQVPAAKVPVVASAPPPPEVTPTPQPVPTPEPKAETAPEPEPEPKPEPASIAKADIPPAPAPEPAPVPAPEAPAATAPAKPAPAPEAPAAAAPPPPVTAEIVPPSASPGSAPPPPPPVASPSETETAQAAPQSEPKPQESALPPVGQMAPGRALQVMFAAEASRLPDSAKENLRGLVEQILDKPDLRLQLLAYAGAEDLSSSRARRLSLSRALAVRSFLIESGLRSTRIDVRALGNKTTEEPANRVDVNIIER